MLKKSSNTVDSPKAIFFDMDGVLVDSEALHWESVHQVLRKYLGSQAPQLEPRVGWGDQDLWYELIERYGLPSDPISLTQERGTIALDLLKSQAPLLMEGALEAVQAWHAHPQCPIMAVVSASPKAQMIQSLENYVDSQGRALFDAFFSGVDDSDLNKPSSQPYLKAMQHFSVSPKESWIAEDSNTGLTSALNSHACVFAISAHTADQVLISQAENEFATLTGLFDLWPKINE